MEIIVLQMSAHYYEMRWQKEQAHSVSKDKHKLSVKYAS